jgi:hypothetical protein
MEIENVAPIKIVEEYFSDTALPNRRRGQVVRKYSLVI